MSHKLMDSVTGQIYSLEVNNGKLIMTNVTADNTLAETSIQMLDSATGSLYSIQIVDGELTMTNDIAEDASTIERARLIEYLPMFIQQYAEMEAIMNAEQVSVEKAWKYANDVMCDQFVAEATVNGVRRWEGIFGITPKLGTTLTERKFQILTRLNVRSVYTVEVLISMLKDICGENNFNVRLDYDNYMLTIKLSLSSNRNIDAVKTLLRRIVPANIVIVVSYFNTHDTLSRFTDGMLTGYTQKQVREETL